MKRIVFCAALTLIASSAFAEDNVGTCGWGSKLFDGQKGVAPQVLAVTTNGSTGNQTFGITSGTSGCTQGGVVKSAWKTAAYLDGNINKFARDVSRGEGESLESFMHLANVSSSDSAAFKTAMKENFGTIFSESDVSSNTVLANMKSVLSANNQLSKYSETI